MRQEVENLLGEEVQHPHRALVLVLSLITFTALFGIGIFYYAINSTATEGGRTSSGDSTSDADTSVESSETGVLSEEQIAKLLSEKSQAQPKPVLSQKEIDNLLQSASKNPAKPILSEDQIKKLLQYK